MKDKRIVSILSSNTVHSLCEEGQCFHLYLMGFWVTQAKRSGANCASKIYKTTPQSVYILHHMFLCRLTALLNFIQDSAKLLPKCKKLFYNRRFSTFVLKHVYNPSLHNQLKKVKMQMLQKVSDIVLVILEKGLYSQVLK